jgi:hypothetical protein
MVAGGEAAVSSLNAAKGHDMNRLSMTASPRTRTVVTPMARPLDRQRHRRGKQPIEDTEETMSLSQPRFRIMLYATIVVMALLFAQVGQAVKPSPARADGSSCEGVMPYTCLYVYGSGYTVREVAAVHVHGAYQYCNYSASFAIYRANGKQMWSGRRTQHGCSYVRPWIRMNNPNKNTGRGGYVCARWYENGSQHGGRTCLTLG